MSAYCQEELMEAMLVASHDKNKCNRDNWLSGPLLAFLVKHAPDWFPGGILMKQFQAAGATLGSNLMGTSNNWMNSNARSALVSWVWRRIIFSSRPFHRPTFHAKRCPKQTSNSPRANQGGPTFCLPDAALAGLTFFLTPNPFFDPSLRSNPSFLTRVPFSWIRFFLVCVCVNLCSKEDYFIYQHSRGATSWA